MVPITRQTHFPLVQSLRGIASFWVVLFHAAEGHHIDRLLASLPTMAGDLIFRAGHLGVAIFFALSGFVISHSLRDLPFSGGLYGRFILRRAIRLDPPYWTSIILVVAFGVLSALVKNEPVVLPGIETVLAHLLYLQTILGLPAINVVYWTLAYEFQFYLFFAGLLTLGSMLRHRLPQAIKLVWIVMFGLALISAAGGFPWVWRGVFLDLWATFFLGVLAYHGTTSRAARYAGLFLAVPILYKADSFMLISAATALLLWLATVCGIAQRKAFFSGMQFLGLISYSLYLVHNPLTGAVSFLCHRLLAPSIVSDVIVLVAIIAVSVAGAYLFWWLIERPTHRWTRKIKLVRVTSGSGKSAPSYEDAKPAPSGRVS